VVVAAVVVVAVGSSPPPELQADIVSAPAMAIPATMARRVLRSFKCLSFSL
jgi:hypothetical protein